MFHCIGGMGRNAGQSNGHERTVAGTRTKIAFSSEAFEDIKRGFTRDAELRGEIAGGGQAFARCQPPFDNTAAQLPVDLSAQVVAAANGHMNFHCSGILE